MADIRRLIGLVLSVIVLTVMSFITGLLDKLARLMVKGLELLFGAEIEHRPYNAQRVHNEPVYEVPNSIINEKETLSQAKFPFTPEQLIEKTKILLSKEATFGAKKPELLSEDYQFIFPVVGPLTKEEFATAFTSFKVDEAFPNAKTNYFGFTVDPMEPNRVWYFSRAELKHEGTLKFGKIEYPPTQKVVVSTPQIFSACFDEEGRVFKYTGGYPIDRTIGNCGGLGGVFGIINSVGGTLPFGPEGKPWQPSLQWEAWAKRFPQIAKEWSKA